MVRPWSVHGSEKIELTRIGSKNFMQVEVDVNACAPILVGVVSPVSEILHPPAKFFFWR